MPQARVTWQGVDGMKSRLTSYGQAYRLAVKALLDYYAPEIESYAKEMSPWTDRTGNARQGLYTRVFWVGNTCILILAHSMEYGIYLETMQAGKFSIIWDTLTEFLPDLRSGLQDIGGRGASLDGLDSTGLL